jgi:hypothetical protein
VNRQRRRYALWATAKGGLLVSTIDHSHGLKSGHSSRVLQPDVYTSGWPLLLAGAEINHASLLSAHAAESPTSNIEPHTGCMQAWDRRPCMPVVTFRHSTWLPEAIAAVAAQADVSNASDVSRGQQWPALPTFISQHVLDACYDEINIASGAASHNTPFASR